MSGLTELRERVLAAAGPSGHLDIELMLACDDNLPHRLCTPSYTASIDAALALVERVLPGWDWDVMRFAGRPYEATVTAPDNDPGLWDKVWADIGPTPPLAILAALLSALIAKEGTT